MKNVVSTQTTPSHAVLAERLKACWRPTLSDEHALNDLFVVGRICRFQDDSPAYAYFLGERIGAISTDEAARSLIEEKLLAALLPVQQDGTTPAAASGEDRDPFDDKERAAANRIGLPSIVSQPGRDEGLRAEGREPEIIKAPFRAKGRAIIARLTSPPADEWQPIESAPKDGTYVVVYRPNLGRRAICVEQFDGTIWCAGDGFWPGEPTHWMPLPALPSDAHGTETKPTEGE